MTTGERMRKYRIKHHLTLEKVAESINVSKQTIQRYETGEIKNIPIPKIESLAKLFNVTPSCLVGWEEKGNQYGDEIDNAIDALWDLKDLLDNTKDSRVENVNKMIDELAEFFPN